MGIYLPNMEMPRKGQMLVIFPDGTSYVCFNGMRERLTQTTAVPVPPHGRCIDESELLTGCGYIIADGMACIPVKYIANAPTIIPAEDEHTMDEFMYGQEGNPNDGSM